MVLRQLNTSYPIVRAVVHIFEPASERGTAGIEELQQQTVNLLSFQPVPKKVFDTQLAYAMLAQFGAEAPVPLSEVDRSYREASGESPRATGRRADAFPAFDPGPGLSWIQFFVLD